VKEAAPPNRSLWTNRVSQIDAKLERQLAAVQSLAGSIVETCDPLIRFTVMSEGCGLLDALHDLREDS